MSSVSQKRAASVKPMAYICNHLKTSHSDPHIFQGGIELLLKFFLRACLTQTPWVNNSLQDSGHSSDSSTCSCLCHSLSHSSVSHRVPSMGLIHTSLNFNLKLSVNEVQSSAAHHFPKPKSYSAGPTVDGSAWQASLYNHFMSSYSHK